MKTLGLTMHELHALYVKKVITPLDVVNEVIEALMEDKNNILEATMFDEARDTAKALASEAVEEDNVLWGIPFLIKDNFATKDIETNGSSDILNGFIPLFDAEVVARLKSAKAIPVAKTTLDELGMGGRGTTGHRGVTYNPYGEPQKRIVGGSSCGSASGVASGYVPFSIGSDTGDSIRKPASYAGLVGFKPTWGEISRYGLYAFMSSLDHVGFFTRSVIDMGVLFEATRGFDKKDFTTMNHEVKESVIPEITKSLKGHKIAVIKQIYERYKNKVLMVEFDNLLKHLEEKGAEIAFVDFDKKLLEAIFPTYLLLSCAETTTSNANLTGVNFGNKRDGDTYEDMVRNTRSAFDARIKFRFILGNYSLKRDVRHLYYNRAQKARRLIVEAMNKLFEVYDAVLLPAAPSHAPLVDAAPEPNSEIENNYLSIANLGGNPSITVPLCLSNKMPIGVNVTGKPFDDAKMLRIAYHIEQITNLYNLHVGKVK